MPSNIIKINPTLREIMRVVVAESACCLPRRNWNIYAERCASQYPADIGCRGGAVLDLVAGMLGIAWLLGMFALVCAGVGA